MNGIDYQNFLNILDSVKFGVEFECCFHILNHPLFNINPFKEPEEKLKINRSYIELLKCFNHKNPSVQWTVVKKNDELDYDRWMLVEDSSIDCSKKGICIVKNVSYSYERCSQLVFYPVELVTPVLQGRSGLRILLMVWLSTISGDDIVYNVNESQGLHVNISHKNMTEEFVKLWAYWEPVILQTIPEERRNNKYAIPVFEKITSDVKDVNRLVLEKYQSLHYHPGSRYEVRIHQGTMNLYEILNWTALIMMILAYSVVGYIPGNSDKAQEFFDMIKDSQLKHYFYQKYNLYKNSSWPDVEIDVETFQIFNLSFTSLPVKTQDAILRMRKRSCGIYYSTLQKDIEKYISEENIPKLQEYVNKNLLTWEQFEEFTEVSPDNYEVILKIFPKKKKKIYKILLENAERKMDKDLIQKIFEMKVLDFEDFVKLSVIIEDKNMIENILKKVRTIYTEIMLETAISENNREIFDLIISKKRYQNYHKFALKSLDFNPYYVTDLLSLAKENNEVLTSSNLYEIIKKLLRYPEYFSEVFSIINTMFPRTIDCNDIKYLETIDNKTKLIIQNYVEMNC